VVHSYWPTGGPILVANDRSNCRLKDAHCVSKTPVIDQEWAEFFTVLAPVTAAILALQILAAQFFVNKWAVNRLRQAALIRGLFELAAPLAIALVALYPEGRHVWCGSIGAGLVGLVSVFACLVIARCDVPKSRLPNDSRFDWSQRHLGALIPSIGFILMVVAGVMHNDLGLHIIAWVCIWNTFAGAGQSYILQVLKAPRHSSETVEASAAA
jgi:hypothetical protein